MPFIKICRDFDDKMLAGNIYRVTGKNEEFFWIEDAECSYAIKKEFVEKVFEEGKLLKEA